MKKLAILLTALTLVFGLTACKDDNTSKDNIDTQPQVETSDSTGSDSTEDQLIDDSIDDSDGTTEDASDDSIDNDEDTQEDETTTEKDLVKLSDEDATTSYKTMISRFEMESPSDVYDDVIELLPQMPDHLASILFAKFDKYLENWSMNYSDQMYFEDGPMFRMDTSLGQAFDYETDSYDLDKISNETHKAIIESLLSSGFKFIWLEGSPYPFVDYSQLKSLSEKVPEEVMAFILVMSDELIVSQQLMQVLSLAGTNYQDELLILKKQ